MTELTGGQANYYVVKVEAPRREEQVPYQAECEDIISALQMTFDEGCIFKALWRTAAARQGNGKAGVTPLYDAEKILHYAKQVERTTRARQPAPQRTPFTDRQIRDMYTAPLAPIVQYNTEVDAVGTKTIADAAITHTDTVAVDLSNVPTTFNDQIDYTAIALQAPKPHNLKPGQVFNYDAD
jgi:hypothetical protein